MELAQDTPEDYVYVPPRGRPAFRTKQRDIDLHRCLTLTPHPLIFAFTHTLTFTPTLTLVPTFTLTPFLTFALTPSPPHPHSPVPHACVQDQERSGAAACRARRAPGGT